MLNDKTKNNKEVSESSGFENDGKMMNHFMEVYVKDSSTLKPTDMLVYRYLSHVSFGYTNNIQFEIEASIKSIMKHTRMSDKTITASLGRLEDSKLISRVRWQNFGPRQVYKYKVMFPKKYHLKIKKETEHDVAQKLYDSLDKRSKGIFNDAFKIWFSNPKSTKIDNTWQYYIVNEFDMKLTEEKTIDEVI